MLGTAPKHTVITDAIDQGTRHFKRVERLGEATPADWEPWLKTLFPRYVRHPFADRHKRFWEWVWAIRKGVKPEESEVDVWPRGGAKSTSAELAATALGVRNERRYAIYVRMTQDQADHSVGNIATMLESAPIARHYPEHSVRLIGKYGNSKGWRRERVRTGGGFTVDAMGLDTASRGAKVDEDRPDLIILDDIDNKLDALATTLKKIAIITTSILPAGSEDVAILAIQNLIIADGFFTRLTDGRADYLARRHVNGPYPAIEGLTWEWEHEARSNTRHAKITGGRATWEGQSLERCQKMIDDIGIGSFLKECQHDVKARGEGIALRFEERRHLVDITDERARELVKLGQPFGGIDFGAWRFGFVLRAADTAGVPHQVAEYFAQRGVSQNHDTHAKAIDAICSFYGCPHNLRIWGDAANAQDITELNRAFKRIKSPFRVMAVAFENKIRKPSVDRLNDLLDKNALTYRRGVTHYVTNILAAVDWPNVLDPNGPAIKKKASDFTMWLLGHNAASTGEPMEGSRLLWEVEHWAYPIPVEGKTQDQDPDDHTADGADLIAADRYANMSWWRPGKERNDEEVSAFDPAVLAAESERTRTLKHRMERRKKIGRGGIDTGGY
jgi:ribosomal protein L13E